MIRSDSGYPKGQPQAIGWFAAGNVALAHAKFDEAVENFKRVLDKDLTPKFFLHWYWRMQAQLGMANAWLASGDLGSARAEACRLLESALATADPNLQVLAWDLRARVAIAEKNWNDAEESAQKGRSILAKFELPTVAWRLYQTSWDLNRHLKNEATAEAQRKCAEQFVLKLADSFAPQEPLRATFLGAAAVRRIFGQNSANAPRRRKRRQRSGR
jgi:tetratricopeptide (TPR) repeat protein